MSALLRIGTSALRASVKASSNQSLRNAGLNGLRCYSSGKSKVRRHGSRFAKQSANVCQLVSEGYFRRQTTRRDREDQEAQEVRKAVHVDLLILGANGMAFRDYGSKVIGEVTLDQVYGGARGIKSLVWEVRVTTSNGCVGAYKG